MIDSITYENFKCFDTQTVNFGALTIFAGSNSVGKSTVLQSILLCRTTLDKLVQYNLIDGNPTFDSDTVIHVPLNGRYLLSLGNTKEVLTRDSNTNQISFLIKEKGNSSKLFLPYRAEDVSDHNYDLELKSSWKSEGDFKYLKNEFYYLNAERLGPRLSYDADQLDYPHVGWQGEYSIQILSQKKGDSIENPGRGFKDEADSKIINQVRSWMSYIIPGFYLDDATLEGRLKKAHTTFSKSSPTNVGFGISYVLPVVVNGLIAKNDSLFIVENPEAHLHPSGQSRIGYFLAKIAATGPQVLIETHSEHVINGIRIATLENTLRSTDVIVNFFNRDQNNRTTTKEINITKTGDLTSYPKGFFDQEQKDISTIVKLKNASLEDDKSS